MKTEDEKSLNETPKKKKLTDDATFKNKPHMLVHFACWVLYSSKNICNMKSQINQISWKLKSKSPAGYTEVIIHKISHVIILFYMDKLC